MIADYMLSALRNLYRHKIRTLLTILGILIGTSSVTAIFAVGNGGQAQVMEIFKSFGIEGLIVNARLAETGDEGLFSNDDLKYIKDKVDEVKSVMPLVSLFGAVGINNIYNNCLIWGIGANANDVVSMTPKYGRNINEIDIENSKKVCIVDTGLSSFIYKRENIVGKKLILNIYGKSAEFTVAGVINKNSSVLEGFVGSYIPYFVYIPYTVLEEMGDFNRFENIAVKIKDSTDMDFAGDKIVSVMKTKNGVSTGYYTENMVKQKNKIENIIGIITIIVSAVAAISLIVGGLGIMTIMLVAVNERTKEIGIKKAVGAKKSDILVEFVTEALIITLFGGIIGLIIGIIISNLAGNILGFEAVLDYKIMFISLIFCMFIGIIFSVYPAKKAAQLNPIEALRHE